MIDQTSHERRASVSVSTLAVASVVHPEENPLALAVYKESEQENPFVSYNYKNVLAFTDDSQAQESISGIFANAPNIHIIEGAFNNVISPHCCMILVLILWSDQY